MDNLDTTNLTKLENLLNDNRFITVTEEGTLKAIAKIYEKDTQDNSKVILSSEENNVLTALNTLSEKSTNDKFTVDTKDLNDTFIDHVVLNQYDLRISKDHMTGYYLVQICDWEKDRLNEFIPIIGFDAYTIESALKNLDTFLSQFHGKDNEFDNFATDIVNGPPSQVIFEDVDGSKKRQI